MAQALPEFGLDAWRSFRFPPGQASRAAGWHGKTKGQQQDRQVERAGMAACHDARRQPQREQQLDRGLELPRPAEQDPEKANFWPGWQPLRRIAVGQGIEEVAHSRKGSSLAWSHVDLETRSWSCFACAQIETDHVAITPAPRAVSVVFKSRLSILDGRRRGLKQAFHSWVKAFSIAPDPGHQSRITHRRTNSKGKDRQGRRRHQQQLCCARCLGFWGLSLVSGFWAMFERVVQFALAVVLQPVPDQH